MPTSTKSVIKNGLQLLLPRVCRLSLLRLATAIAPADFLIAAHRWADAPNQELTLERVAGAGYAPRMIVDVGAYEGEWTKMVKRIWPEASVVMVEPNLEKRAKLERVAKETRSEVQFELLGAKAGQSVQFQLMQTGSSVFPEQSTAPRTTQVRKLTTLDRLLKGTKIDLLKIDTQGYEVEVLKGCKETLKNVEMVILELSLLDINRGAPLMFDVMEFMNKIGFVIYDVVEFHRRPKDGVLWQMDCLMVPENSSLRSDKKFD